MSATNGNLHALYDGLSRFHWLCRRLRRSAPGAGLEMHKRLAPPAADEPGPDAGTAGLNDWLLHELAPAAEARVLDVGCGFGATLLAWAPSIRGPLVGLTASSYQADRAIRQARSTGVADRCEFRVQSYREPIAGAFDLIVSIEALAHADEPAETIASLATTLAPNGRLAMVEDMATTADAGPDRDLRELCQRWHTPLPPTRAIWLEALTDAGLVVDRDIDLTAQVAPAPARSLRRRVRRLTWLRRVLPTRRWRGVVDAFLGGIALERLYARGCVEYRALFASRPEGMR